MSLFLCPLCGKQTSIRLYQPETFDDDVEVFHNTSLGRGKGFEKVLGFDINEFPELREKLVNRSKHIIGFLDPQQAPKNTIQELNQQLEEEQRRRIAVEEQLVETDTEYLLFQLNGPLEDNYSDLPSAVMELISRYHNLNNSNQSLSSSIQKLESTHHELYKENMNQATEINRLQKENISLRVIVKKAEIAHQNLKTQYNQKKVEYSNALTNERNKRKVLEDHVEELDLDVLLHNINEYCERNHSSIHSGVKALIEDNDSLEDEHEEVLDLVNEKLPEKYELFDNLGEAVDALIQYYEDQIEELSDL